MFIAIEIGFRCLYGLLSLAIMCKTVQAIVRRNRVWADRSSAYMQLLVLTCVINLMQTCDVVFDVVWMAQGPMVRGSRWMDQCGSNQNSTAIDSQADFLCRMQRVDASMSYLSLGLLLIAFVVVAFFFLRLVLRLRLPSQEGAQLQEAQRVLKMPLWVSLGWISLVMFFSCIGSFPHAFSCQDPAWLAFLASFLLIAVVLFLGILILHNEGRKRRRPNVLWLSLFRLACAMFLSAIFGILQSLDHFLRDMDDCDPFDASYSSSFFGDDDWVAAALRGLIFLFSNMFIFSVPSFCFLALFHSSMRPTQRVEQLAPVQHGRQVGGSMTEALIRGPHQMLPV
mmetsp:Transcript_51997/g.161710  ORF Transcript_51997/g.161710 Transcript_51997/m.161710 type:complete len:339 (-) Transcript_51997:130-1146(-)